MSKLVGNTSEIGLIDTNRLQVNQANTSLRWDSQFKHPDFSILNLGVTAKLHSRYSGEKAILSNTGYLIGTASESIMYKVHQGSTIHVGLAEDNRDLSSLIPGDNLVSHKLQVESNSTITMDLTTTKLKITYSDKTTTLDITGYSGKTMYAWLSDDDSKGGMSISIFKTARLSIYVDTDDKVVFETTSSNGVDRPIKFDTGSSSVEFTGGQLITDTVHNIIQSDTGTPMILRESGGIDVTIDSTGSITTTGNVSCTNITADTLTASVSTPLVVTSSGADSSLLSVGGDVIIKADGSGLTVASTTGDVTFDSTASASSFVSNSIRSSPGGNLTLYEQSGEGLTIQNSTGNAEFSSDVSVLGDIGVNNISSKTANNLDLTENSGLGLHVADSTGVVTSDARIIVSDIRSASAADLQLHNSSGLGLEIKDNTGDAELVSNLTIDSTLYGSSDLVLRNNTTDEKGITINSVSGDVNCDSDLNVTGSVSVGPTLVDNGICFAASAVGGQKAMLLPRTSNHTIISPLQAGMIVFNTTDQTLRIYNGSVWQTLSAV